MFITAGREWFLARIHHTYPLTTKSSTILSMFSRVLRTAPQFRSALQQRNFSITTRMASKADEMVSEQMKAEGVPEKGSKAVCGVPVTVFWPWDADSHL